MATEIVGMANCGVGAEIVWLEDRVGERIGARRPGEWTMRAGRMPGVPYHEMRQLAEAWEREHGAELAPLFKEAKKARRRRRG
jgi:hypothetical protein